MIIICYIFFVSSVDDQKRKTKFICFYFCCHNSKKRRRQPGLFSFLIATKTATNILVSWFLVPDFFIGFSYLYMYILMVFFSNDTFPANGIDKAEHSVLFYTHTSFQNMRKACKAYLHHALHLIDDKGKVLKKEKKISLN